MHDRVAKIIDWWCTGAAAVLVGIILFAMIVGTPDRGAVVFLCIFLGVPGVLIFLFGKSVRYVLAARGRPFPPARRRVALN